MTIIPRIILVTILCIDTKRYHKLYYIYTILILNCYIIYSFKFVKESLIHDLIPLTHGITIAPFIFELYEELYNKEKEINADFDEDDWELDDIPPTLFLKDIELFVKFHLKFSSKIRYYLSPNTEMMKTIKGAENVSYNTNWTLYSKYLKQAKNILKEKMKDILQISYIITKYESTHQHGKRY